MIEQGERLVVGVLAVDLYVSYLSSHRPQCVMAGPARSESQQQVLSALSDIEINGQHLTPDLDLTDAARDILQRLQTGH